MRRLLLITILLLTACQKDYYLEDLNEANKQIELLTSQKNDALDRVDLLEDNLQQERASVSELLNIKEIYEIQFQDLVDELNGLVNHIDTLETTISNLELELQNLNEDSLSNIEDLNSQISALEDEIASLEIDVAMWKGYYYEAIDDDEINTIEEIQESVVSVPVVTQPADDQPADDIIFEEWKVDKFSVQVSNEWGAANDMCDALYAEGNPAVITYQTLYMSVQSNSSIVIGSRVWLNSIETDSGAFDGAGRHYDIRINNNISGKVYQISPDGVIVDIYSCN